MLKKFLIIAAILSVLICGCSTKVEPEQDAKKKQKQEQTKDEFFKPNFKPSEKKEW